RRADSTIAIEQRCAEEGEQQQRRRRAEGRATVLSDERDEGEDPSLAVVVRAHEERQVLERNDRDERPEDDRENAEHVRRRRRERRGADEALLEREERVRADVAVDDAERAEGERGRRRLVDLQASKPDGR